MKKIPQREQFVPPLRITDLIYYKFREFDKQYSKGLNKELDLTEDFNGFKRVFYMQAATAIPSYYMVGLNEDGNFYRVSRNTIASGKQKGVQQLGKRESCYQNIDDFIERFNEWAEEVTKLEKL